MRSSLAELNGRRVHVVAHLQRLGSKDQDRKITMVLDDVVRVRQNDSQYHIAHHIWIEVPRGTWNGWQSPMQDDYIEFTARVFEYMRHDGTTDYSLNEIRNLSRALPGHQPPRARA